MLCYVMLCYVIMAAVQISRERSYPQPMYWYHPKDDKFRYFIPHFEEVRGSVEPWLMAHWKARVELLLSVTELIFLSLVVEALQGKTCQNSLPSGGVGRLELRFQGEVVAPVPVCWYHSKGNWLRYNLALDIFYIMKLCSRLFVLYCRNCPKDVKFRYFIPILRKLGAAYNLGWWLVGKPVSRSC